MGTDGPRGRARVHTLVATDPSAALEVARAMTDAWYRCQALTEVAEHLDERKKKLGVLEEAFDAADATLVLNRIVTVASWPLRVLASCNAEERLAEQTRRLLEVIAPEPHPIRRMDAQAALLSALVACPIHIQDPVLEALLSTIRRGHGWKRERTIHFVASLFLSRGEASRAWALIDECEIPKEARRARRELEARFGPRPM